VLGFFCWAERLSSLTAGCCPAGGHLFRSSRPRVFSQAGTDKWCSIPATDQVWVGVGPMETGALVSQA